MTDYKRYHNLLPLALSVLMVTSAPSYSQSAPPYKLDDHAAKKIPTYVTINNEINKAISKHSSTGLITDLTTVSGRRAQYETLNSVVMPTILFRKTPLEASRDIAILVAGMHGDEFYGTTALFEVVKTLIESYDPSSSSARFQTSILA
jgi:hypothetical protein